MELDFQKIYDKCRLKEIRLDKYSFSNYVKRAFYRNLPSKTTYNTLPNDFLLFLSKTIISKILEKDKKAFDGEGIFLYEQDGYFRRGAFSLAIRAFVDLVVEICAVYAKQLVKIKNKKFFEEYEKVFLQTFLDDSAMNSGSSNWKTTFKERLVEELENVEKIYIEYSSKSC